MLFRRAVSEEVVGTARSYQGPSALLALFFLPSLGASTPGRRRLRPVCTDSDSETGLVGARAGAVASGEGAARNYWDREGGDDDDDDREGVRGWARRRRRRRRRRRGRRREEEGGQGRGGGGGGGVGLPEGEAGRRGVGRRNAGEERPAPAGPASREPPGPRRSPPSRPSFLPPRPGRPRRPGRLGPPLPVVFSTSVSVV